MARKPYHGVTGPERTQVARLKRALRASGQLPPPPPTDECEACGQRSGKIELHCEDYTTLADVGIALCFVCHRMVHLRDRNPAGWDTYRALIRSGCMVENRSDISYVSHAVMAGRAPRACRRQEPRDRTVLDEIHDEVRIVGTLTERRARLAVLLAGRAVPAQPDPSGALDVDAALRLFA